MFIRVGQSIAIDFNPAQTCTWKTFQNFWNSKIEIGGSFQKEESANMGKNQ
jgi:hypothetical protein